MSGDIGSVLQAEAERLVELQRTVYERVACPRCRAPVGEGCCRMPIGWHGPPQRVVPLKHSHIERLRADGLELR